jgi:superfamily II DNA/RNA helicase
MGQLWDRIRRVSESYINDVTNDIDLSKIDPKILEELRARQGSSSSSASSSYSRRGYETEEERLKRLIDEAANPQAKNTASSSSQGNSSNSSSNSSSNQQQQSRRHNPHQNGGLTIEGALHVIGLPANASNEDIKRTYKKLMMQYHPDRVSHLDAGAQHQARDKAQRINQAYQIIKDARGL